MIQNTPNPVSLSWTSILLLMSFFGMFGGILDVLGIIDIKKLVDVNQKHPGPIIASGKRFIAALVLGGIGGIGGAFAMLFVIVAAAKLDTADTPVNKLLLSSLGVVSGFLGFRVLRGVARGVERQIQESEARQEAKTAEQIRDTEDRAKQRVDYFDAITSGLKFAEESEKPLPSVQYQLISKLETMRDVFPNSRELTIVLARVYKKIERDNDAITVLSEFVDRHKNSGRDKDVADVLYNRACYYNLKADKLGDGDKRKQPLKEKAYDDLTESIRLSAENKKDAAKDPDLKTLWSEEKFKQLVA